MVVMIWFWMLVAGLGNPSMRETLKKEKHPFYVSMTEIHHRPQEKKLEVAVRIFTDDLEKALAKQCACSVDLLSENRKKINQPLLETYIGRKIRFMVNGKEVSLKFLGFDREEESIWSFLEVSLPGTLDRLEVENKLLYEIQQRQTNLIRLVRPGSDQTRQLQQPETMVRF
jgi:hypothetical protein